MFLFFFFHLVVLLSLGSTIETRQAKVLKVIAPTHNFMRIAPAYASALSLSLFLLVASASIHQQSGSIKWWKNTKSEATHFLIKAIGLWQTKWNYNAVKMLCRGKIFACGLAFYLFKCCSDCVGIVVGQRGESTKVTMRVTGDHQWSDKFSGNCHSFLQTTCGNRGCFCYLAFVLRPFLLNHVSKVA